MMRGGCWAPGVGLTMPGCGATKVLGGVKPLGGTTTGPSPCPIIAPPPSTQSQGTPFVAEPLREVRRKRLNQLLPLPVLQQSRSLFHMEQPEVKSIDPLRASKA